MRAELCMRYGWVPDVVDNMPWDVIESMWHEGKRSDGIAVTSVEDVLHIQRNWKRYIQGLG